jgi:hypothetical protein
VLDPTQIGLSTIGAVFGVVVSAGGYVIRRRLTGARATERADLLTKLADLKSKLEGHGYTVEDIESLESHLTSASRNGRHLGRPAKLVASLAAAEPDLVRMAASASLELAQASGDLVKLAMKYEALLSDEERRYFVTAQEAWEVFRDAEAGRVASEYAREGFGSLIATIVTLGLVFDRMAAIHSELGVRSTRARRVASMRQDAA